VSMAVAAATELFGTIVPPAVTDAIARQPARWQDRLTLRQAPRDASSPLMHVGCNLLCTPGIGFRLRYARALLWPGSHHLAGVYPFRHPGWTLCAQLWRAVRALYRTAAASLGGVRILATPRAPQLSR
jgi:hypothetical protein